MQVNKTRTRFRFVRLFLLSVTPVLVVIRLNFKNCLIVSTVVLLVLLIVAALTYGTVWITLLI